MAERLKGADDTAEEPNREFDRGGWATAIAIGLLLSAAVVCLFH